MRILSNIPALQSYNALSETQSALQKSINRLSTGYRINNAADDAAGLAISEKMRAQIRGLDQATSNAQDGISMIQTAEGALNETHAILQRMRELSVQAANDTLTQQDRGYIQLEIDQLKEEVTRISNTTQFNKKKLLDGSAAVLWSSDNLNTKAIINGGLRQVDQFGQKMALEGNFKISINADPGQAEIKKTDIFKIKHKNVIMDVSLDQSNGFQSIRVDNLPAGQYRVQQGVNSVVAKVGMRLNLSGAQYLFARSGGAYEVESFLAYASAPGAAVKLSAVGSATGTIYLRVSALTGGYVLGGKTFSNGTTFKKALSSLGISLTATLNYSAKTFLSAKNTSLSSLKDARSKNEAILWNLLEAKGISIRSIPKREESLFNKYPGYEMESFLAYASAPGAAVKLSAVGSATGTIYLRVSALTGGYVLGGKTFSNGTTFKKALSSLGISLTATLNYSAKTFLSAKNTSLSSLKDARAKNEAILVNLLKSKGIDVKALVTDETQYYYRTGNASAPGYSFNAFYGLNSANANMKVTMSSLADVQNASVLLTVLDKNDLNGTVTFRAQVSQMDVNGKVVSFEDSNLIIGKNGVAAGYTGLGFRFMQASAISIDGVGAYDAGDKMVLNFRAVDPNATGRIIITGSVNPNWDGAWKDPLGNPAKLGVRYNVNATALQNQTVHFKHFYLNTANGTVHEGAVVVGFNDKMRKLSGGIAGRASFNAAYVGQVATGDAKLRDLDKFWDANGKFLLEDSQQITIYQGNGKKTGITLNSTDTLNDVRNKLNDAIAYGLGQAQYVPSDADKFVSFVEDPIPNSPDSTRGTFVIRSLIAGSEGRLAFSGDEDVIKSLSMNVVQESKESTFSVSVTDAHDGTNIASNVKVTGNMLKGVVNPNVDVMFDSMANVTAKWNKDTLSFDLLKEAQTYETFLHLADNTTVFQIGANEGEDMGVDMGDMSARALGIDRVLVTDRESASRSISLVDSALDRVSNQRAKLGAYQNRLEHTIKNLTTASMNTTAAESRIRDVDMAKEMMNFAKLNILSQAGTSMLAQANQLPQGVLSLLR